MPEILELLETHGPMPTAIIKDHMVRVAAQKNLVYVDAAVTRALTILKWRQLAINEPYAVWSTTKVRRAAIHGRYRNFQRETSERSKSIPSR